MASLDEDSLFTNVPLDETIEICVNELFKTSQTVSGLNKQQVFEMLQKKPLFYLMKNITVKLME